MGRGKEKRYLVVTGDSTFDSIWKHWHVNIAYYSILRIFLFHLFFSFSTVFPIPHLLLPPNLFQHPIFLKLYSSSLFIFFIFLPIFLLHFRFSHPVPPPTPSVPPPVLGAAPQCRPRTRTIPGRRAISYYSRPHNCGEDHYCSGKGRNRWVGGWVVGSAEIGPYYDCCWWWMMIMMVMMIFVYSYCCYIL